MTDDDILNELRGHLTRFREWADPADVMERDGWSCICSTLRAVAEGKVGLALERWDDLYSPNKPELSEAAQNWSPAQNDPYASTRACSSCGVLRKDLDAGAKHDHGCMNVEEA